MKQAQFDRGVLTPDEAADYLGVTSHHLRRLRGVGGGPKFLPWGARTIRYRKVDLEAWLDSQPTASNTTEASRILEAS